MSTVEPGIIAIIIMISVFLNLITMAYTAHQHIDTIEAHLSNCKYITDFNSLYSGEDLRSKVQRLWGVAFVLAVPGPLIRRKLIDIHDIENFPASLKVRILAAWLIGIFAMTALTLFYFWTHYFLTSTD